ncbi:hypothetical protein FB567DRAFT_596596 [Paraphoma chrysanthemicola]|uniref:Uncharacterized protein n=1 Tax=Paraphoma chrysanthemicola TaxID=798071 RepID=A0A8K0R0B3_9PLEO|nr:hypothetical protein FB567DRAFT_596596 [Paraphoma chrysanthemicola]
MPTSFFDLPRELRDRVYDFVWEDSALFELHQDRVCSSFATYPSGFGLPIPTAKPKWLLTNKAFLLEGLSQFRRGGYIELAYQDLTPIDLPFPRRQPLLLLPSNVRDLRVFIESYSEQSGNNFVCYLAPLHLRNLDRQLRSANAHNTLRKLKVEITIHVSQAGFYPQSKILAGLTFVLVRVLPILDQFEFSIRYKTKSWMSRCLVHTALCFEVDDLDTVIEREWSKSAKHIKRVLYDPQNQDDWRDTEWKWSKV